MHAMVQNTGRPARGSVGAKALLLAAVACAPFPYIICISLYIYISTNQKNNNQKMSLQEEGLLLHRFWHDFRAETGVQFKASAAVRPELTQGSGPRKACALELVRACT